MSHYYRAVPMQTIAIMSSLEIVDVINEERKADAAIVGTRYVPLRHDNFLAKLEKHPGIQSPKFLGDYTDDRGRPQKCYYLPKREAELMVMSESLKVQTRVYDRLAEKEAAALSAPAFPNFADEIEAAEAWVAAKKEARAQTIRANQQYAKAAQLQSQVAKLAPAAAALERIASDCENFCLTDAAKHLQLAPRRFTKLLLEKGWIYVREAKKGYVASQPQIDSDYLTHRYGNYQDPDTGQWKKNAQVMVTSKGIAKLAKMLSIQLPTQQGNLQI